MAADRYVSHSRTAYHFDLIENEKKVDELDILLESWSPEAVITFVKRNWTNTMVLQNGSIEVKNAFSE